MSSEIVGVVLAIPTYRKYSDKGDYIMTNTKMEQIRFYLERMYHRERFGKAGDDKPTDNLSDGDKYTEMDTGDVYMYYDTAWHKVV